MSLFCDKIEFCGGRVRRGERLRWLWVLIACAAHVCVGQDALRLEGSYWGLWGDDLDCVYHLEPAGPDSFVGEIQLRRGGTFSGEIIPVDLTRNARGQWCLNWEPRDGDDGCADDLNGIQTLSGPCIAANYTTTDPHEGVVWNVALIWLDPGLLAHPNLAPNLTELVPTPSAAASVVTYSAEDGLASNNVRSIEQQGDTYLWIGTTGGLSRFDGTYWDTFTPGTHPAFTDGHITSILSKSDGSMVFATKKGGIVFYQGNRFRAPVWNQRLANQKISNLVEAPDGSVWFINNQTHSVMGIDREGALVDFPVESWAPLRYGRDPGLGGPVNIEPLGASRLLIGSRAGLRVLDVESGSSFVGDIRWGDSAVYRLRSGALWARSENFFGPLDEETLSYGASAFGYYGVGPMIESRNGDLWFTTVDDLFRFRDGKLERFPEVSASMDSHLGPLLEDHEGNLWVTSAAHGVARVHPHVVTSWRAGGELPECQPQSIATSDSGRTVIAAGRLVADFVDGCLHAASVNRDLGAKGKLSRASWAQNYLEHECAAFSRDGSEVVWIGLSNQAYQDQGPEFWLGDGPLPILARWDGEGFRYYGSEELMDGVGHGSSIDVNRRGEVWYATSQGVQVLGPDGTVRPWVSEEGDSPRNASTILVDREDRVWIATADRGVYLVQLDGGAQRFNVENGSLHSDTCRTLFEDSQGGVWLGTAGGLTLVDQGVFQSREGLDFINGSILGMVEDSGGRLWFGTTEGVFALDLESFRRWMRGSEAFDLTVRAFGRHDGMVNVGVHEEHQPIATLNGKGEVIFCVNEGMVSVHSDEALVAKGRLLSTIRRCYRLDEDFWPTGDEEGGRLTLPPKAQELVQFEFATFTYTRPQAIHFEHRLRGLTDQWTPVGRQRNALFSGLGPGAYEFEVRAVDDQGALGKTDSLAFRIRPTPTQTLWFKGGVGLSGVGAVVFIHRVNVRRRLKKEEARKNREFARERMRIARDVHDEIGVGLASIRLLSSRVQGLLAVDDPGVEKPLRRIEQFADEASESLREVIWELRNDTNGVSSLGDFAHQFLTERLDSTGVQLDFQVDEALPGEGLSPQMKRTFMLNLKGIVSNVLRHANAKRLKVRIGVRDGQLWALVADDGVGFEVSSCSDNQGSGLASIKERLDASGGRLLIRSSPGEGAQIETYAPMQPTSR